MGVSGKELRGLVEALRRKTTNADLLTVLDETMRLQAEVDKLRQHLTVPAPVVDVVMSTAECQGCLKKDAELAKFREVKRAAVERTLKWRERKKVGGHPKGVST